MHIKRFHPLFALSFLIISALACSLPIDFTPPPIPSQVPAGNPTNTPSVVTAIPPTATTEPVPFPALSQFSMLDANNGWGSDESGHLYHTTAGGQNWLDRSPQNTQTGLWGNAFLDADHAWLVQMAADSPLQLLRTSDSGQTWETITPSGLGTDGMPILRFTSPNDGQAEVAGLGAGNLYARMFTTHDGGATWTVVPIKPFNANEDLPEGTLHLCNICGVDFYYDTARIIVIEGDLASMEPRGAVHLQFTTDLGKNWSEQTLPLPTQYSDGLVEPLGTTFVGPKEGFLLIRLVKYNADNSTAYDIFTIYITRDGGASWNLTPTAVEQVTSSSMRHFISPTDAILQCGASLCVTRDAAQTWQTITPNINIAATDTRYVTQIQFLDLNTGWLILSDSGKYEFYKTTDGGANWILLTH
jgi:photosystem II stability/assembly factor-like uncharacterized protein